MVIVAMVIVACVRVCMHACVRAHVALRAHPPTRYAQPPTLELWGGGWVGGWEGVGGLRKGAWTALSRPKRSALRAQFSTLIGFEKMWTGGSSGPESGSGTQGSGGRGGSSAPRGGGSGGPSGAGSSAPGSGKGAPRGGGSGTRGSGGRGGSSAPRGGGSGAPSGDRPVRPSEAREAKRRQAIANIVDKVSRLYQVDEGALAEVPDPGDCTISKRRWERVFGEWRHTMWMRACRAGDGGSSAQRSGSDAPRGGDHTPGSGDGGGSSRDD